MTHDVILVDDEPIIKQSLQKLIEQTSDFHVVGVAENGKEALQLAKRYSPKLIITDIRMPIMDGLELMKIAKEYNSSVEIILLTGYAEFEFARQAVKLGAIDYLLKPIEPDLLANALDKIRAKWDAEHKQSALVTTNEWIWKCKELGNRLIELIWADYERDLQDELNSLHNLLQSTHWGSLPILYRQLADYMEREIYNRSNKLINIAPPPFPASFIGEELNELLRQWFRMFVSRLSQKLRSSRNWNVHHTVMKAIEHIESFYDNETLSLSSAAERLGISNSYLSRCFSEEQGISFIQYVNKYRMNKAIEYLQNPKLKTYEIAYKVGFSDYRHFARTFKKYFGFSASAYRKKIQWENT